MFVVVALGASDTETKEDGTDGRGDFTEHFVTCLVASRFGERSEPEECHGHDPFRIGQRKFASAEHLGKLVAGQLLLDEQIVGLVAVEAVDDVVAVSPGVRQVGVAFVTGGIGVAGEVEPEAGPAFTVSRILEQSVDDGCVGIGGAVPTKRFPLGGRRGQANQVEGHPAEQDVATGRVGRCQAGPFQP